MNFEERGWSPQKHVHRSIFYAEAYTLLKPQVFYSGLHVSLIGSGDDNRYLSDLFHIPKDKILTFDIDKNIYEKCKSEGYRAVHGDIFWNFPLQAKSEMVATFHLDLTGTLPVYFDRILDLLEYINKNALLMITYNVNRTKKSELSHYQKRLNTHIEVGRGSIILDHTNYRSMTIDANGNVKMPRGSTMGSVIYKL